MSRSCGWTHPRRRHRRELGPCVVTYHALDSYRNRIGAVADSAALERIARRAHLIGRKTTGEYVYRGEGCRFIVHRPARREPVVLTVITGEGRHPKGTA